MSMSGNCHHKVSIVTRAYGKGSKYTKLDCSPSGYKQYYYEHPPVVWLVNDNDEYYGECFSNRKEVDVLIKKLEAARDIAWPSPTSPQS